MQRNLSLDPAKDEVLSEPPKEACLNCGAMISVISLREHVVACKRRSSQLNIYNEEIKPIIMGNKGKDHPPECPVIGRPAVDDDSTLQVPLDNPDLQDSVDSPIMIDSECSSPRVVAGRSDSEEFDPALELAIHLSKEDGGPSHTETEPQSIVELIKQLQVNVSRHAIFEMVVRRSNVLVDTLRRMERVTFEPPKKLKVVFIGEEGSDGGGLTREFFRLISNSIVSGYMEPTGCFRHNAVAYQESIYLRLGTLAAMSLVHGGAAFRIFGPTVFRFLSGKNAADLIAGISEVPDPTIRESLKQIEMTKDANQLREFSTDNLDLLLECGFNKPVSKVELSDKVNMIQTVTLHKVILASLAELSQFQEGLSALGVADALKNSPHLLHSYFCSEYHDDLSSDSIRKLFTEIQYSEKGTNDREHEERAFMFFVDYLDDCEKVSALTSQDELEMDDYCGATSQSEGGTEDQVCKVSLRTVLSFFTGADSIPPLGYTSAVISFNPANQYPTASTCAIQLTLPTKHTDYIQFKKQLDVTLTMHGGFGLV